LPAAEGAETVAGYVLQRLGKPPTALEPLECEGYTVVPIDVAGRRIRRVRIVARPITVTPPSLDESA
jgi:CBS domain containing-hemolysin-like protein